MERRDVRQAIRLELAPVASLLAVNGLLFGPSPTRVLMHA